MTPVRAFIFDLDGTLVDSAQAIAGVLNGMRAERGLDPLPLNHFRRQISRGVKELVSRTLPNSAPGEMVPEFRRRYALSRTYASHLYPGVAETIAALRTDGWPLAVCSNKPETLCRKVLVDVGLDEAFTVVVGGDTAAAGKPDPAPLLHALAALGANAAECALVGDSTIDQRAATAGGVRFVFFTGGYDDGVDTRNCQCIDTLSDLLLLFALPREGANA